MVARLAASRRPPSTRSPERLALADALARAAEVQAALKQNEAATAKLNAATPTPTTPRKQRSTLHELSSQERANVADLMAKGWTTEAIEGTGIALFRDPTPEEVLADARKADAKALAEGRPATALAAARLELQQEQDNADTHAAAREVLRRERARLEGLLGDSTMAITSAVVAVCRTEPQIAALVDEFLAARARFALLYGTLFAAPGLPPRAGEWRDFADLMQPKPTAAGEKIKAWVAALRTDASAELDLT